MTTIDNYPCFILFDKTSKKEIQRVQSSKGISFSHKSNRSAVWRTHFKYLDDYHGIICLHSWNKQLWQLSLHSLSLNLDNTNNSFAFEAKCNWPFYSSYYEPIMSEYMKRDGLIFMINEERSSILDLNDNEWIKPRQLSFYNTRTVGLCYDITDRYKIYSIQSFYSWKPQWVNCRAQACYRINYYDFSEDTWYELPGESESTFSGLKHTWISEKNSFLLYCMGYRSGRMYFQCYDLRSGKWRTVNNVSIEVQGGYYDSESDIHIFG